MQKDIIIDEWDRIENNITKVENKPNKLLMWYPINQNIKPVTKNSESFLHEKHSIIAEIKYLIAQIDVKIENITE